MPRRILPWLALLVPALLLFWKLDYSPFWNPDEGRYSAAAYEMAFSFDNKPTNWLVPHLDTITRLNKPPLIYWTQATAFRVLGPTEIAGRLPSALAALIVLLVIYVWGRAAFGRREGIAGALVWGTAVFPFAMARVSNTDMLLAASIMLASFGIYWAIESQKKWQSGLVAGIGMGMALLSKGPVGVALPLLVAFVYLFVVKGWKKAPWGALALALSIAVLIGGPWYWAVEAQRPGFLHQFIVGENWSRYSGTKEFHKPTSKFFYIPTIIGGLLPWTGFLFPAFGTFGPLTTREGRSKLFLALWAILITVFFSLSGTKLVSYVLPAFPALAMLIGVAVARYELLSKTWRGIGLGLTLGFNVVLAFLLGVKPGFFLDDKIVPHSVGAPWTWGIIALAALSCGALIWVARRPSGRTVLLVQGATALALLLVLIPLSGEIGVYEDGGPMVKAIAPLLGKNDRVACYLSLIPAAMFYARRPVTFFEFKDNSGLDEKELARSPYFRNPKTLRAYLDESPVRSFIISDGPLWNGARDPSLVFWGRNNDFFLYVNRPKPADFNFDFFAPRKGKKPSKLPKYVKTERVEP